MKGIAAAYLCALAALAAAPASAQERSAVRPGFQLPSGSAKILVLRPKISVGAQSTAGMAEPNADWTAQARENIGTALQAAQHHLGNDIVVAPEPIGDAVREQTAYEALFAVVARSVINYQFFPGNRLPTKKRKDAFEWSLGPGVAHLARDSGCDYALFIVTDDQYGSTGRKIFQLLAAMAYVSVKSGEHEGFAGLVDLKTGDLLWLNADLEMGGDVRTPDGATKRVRELLKNFPGSEPIKVAAEAGATR